MATDGQANGGFGLELVELSKSYGGKVALDGLSFGVRPGEMFGFVGPNGAGKTTAMRIAIGVLAPDSGEVRWQGQQIGAADRRRIGYMPEERGLYPKMRVGEQLTYLGELHGLGEERARSAAAEWLDRLGIADRADDPVEQLSLGNQQRVQLAASLVFEPQMLILDEPFSGLDPIGVDVLSDVLLEVCREREVPVVFSSHQLELVERLCDAVAIVKGGRLVASGEVDDLRRRGHGRLWRVEVEGAGPGWHEAVAGVRSVGEGLFEAEDDGAAQALLDRAREGGTVVAFGREVPTLAELFRETVSEEEGS